MNIIFEIFINFYQGLLMIFFMDRVLPPSKSTLHWLNFLFVFLIGALFCLCEFIPVSFPDTLIYMIPFIYSITVKRGTWSQRIFWTLILACVMDAVILLMTNLYTKEVDTDMIYQTTPLRVGFVMNTNIVLTIALILVSRIPRHETLEVLHPSSLIALIGSLLLEFTATEFLYYYQLQNNHDERYLFYIYCCILGLIILTLVFYYVLKMLLRLYSVLRMLRSQRRFICLLRGHGRCFIYRVQIL